MDADILFLLKLILVVLCLAGLGWAVWWALSYWRVPAPLSYIIAAIVGIGLVILLWPRFF